MPVRFISILPDAQKPRRAVPREPRLSVPWQTRGSRISESLRALLSGPRAPKEFRGGRFFRDCWVKRHVPRRSIAFSIFWHAAILVVLIQFGSFLLSSPRATMVDNYDLAWSGPINDLPLVMPATAKKHPSPPGDPAKPLPKLGADAFHPHQTLISAPKRPNHPRQTLIRPDAPQEPPKILPEMPNIVQWSAAPPRPQNTIRSDRLLQQPKTAQRAAKIDSPEIPNAEKNIADVNFASGATPERPALTLASGAVVGAPRKSSAAPQSAEPPPIVGAGEGHQHIIALSASPGPARPDAPIPAGNVSANVSISPDGTQPGAPGGVNKGTVSNGGTGGNSSSPGGNAGGANGSGSVVPGISISGGNTKNSPGVSGLNNGAKSNPRSPLHLAPGSTASSPSDKPDSAAAKSPEVPISARIKPGVPPERVLGDKTIYTLNINNPNLSSVSGSWILKFAELDEDSSSSNSHAAQAPARPGTLSGPVPIHKTDPSYPTEQIKQHIEGEVVLFGIIREDGSVDSVQIVRSLDPVLDKNSMDAFAQWKFTPAHRNGNPVAVEAVVHIPFRSTHREY